jgi:hypothetical protein
MVHQMRGALSHAPPTATGTHRPALACERHEPVQAAAVTLKPREASGQEPAPQKATKLLFDEVGQPLTVAHTRSLGTERLEAIAT